MTPSAEMTVSGTQRLLGAAFACLFVCGLPAAAADPAVVISLIDGVDVQNIENHVQAIDYERFTPAAQSTASGYIAAELTSYGYAVVTTPVLSSENLIVRIPGTRFPDDVFIVGAHFDTVDGSPGADDNASGVAGLLEIARLLHGSAPESTIELIAFGLEEIGKIGSNAYAQTLAQQDKTVLGMISMDMIAYSCDSLGCQVGGQSIPGCLTAIPENLTIGTGIAVGSNIASSSLQNLFTAVSNSFVPELEVTTVQVAGTGLCEPNTRRSDHASFWDAGFPALVVSDGAESRNPNYHLASDWSFGLDFDLATAVTRSVLAVVVEKTFPPEEIQAIDLGLSIDGSLLEWLDLPDAIAYDVVRGNLKRLTGSSGSFQLSVETCIANDITSSSFLTNEIVAPGQAKWYLVRPVTALGPSSYSSGTDAVARDAGINASPGACP